MTTKYVSIKSVLYGISLLLDERYWNENKVLEWINRGYRKLQISSSFETKLKELTVTSHKATLPADFKYLIQVMNTTTATAADGEAIMTYSVSPPENTTWVLANANSMYGYRPMRLTSNPYHDSICLDTTISYCTDCVHDFSISPSLVLTTTLAEGTILVSYLGYATDEDGCVLIPDDENLKEALQYYALYMYWTEKDLMKEDGADRRMDKYLGLWQTASVKAKGNLNMPDINEIENIKNHWNRLVPRENKFQQGFLTLGNRENVNF